MSKAAQPEDRLDQSGWRNRFDQKQAELHARAPRLLWLGDSIVAAWERRDAQDWLNFAPVWRHFYDGRDPINLGFAGDATSHLLWRVQNWDFSAVRPGAVILQIGANNFSGIRRWNAAATHAAIGVILSAVAERVPRSPLLLLSAFPSIRDKWIDRNTAELNRLLAADDLSRYHPDARFADLTDLFMEDGRVAEDRFIDARLSPGAPSLHPTAITQARIAFAIEPMVSAMLGDTARMAF